MKSRDGTSQRSEEKKKEYQKRESLRRKKIQVREKVGKPRNTVFFQWFVAPEGRKVGSLKRRVRSQLARWEMKNCTPLWHEAHFEVKSVENWRVRSTFGSWDVEKVQAIVARSTFRSQKCKKLRGSEHFWKLRCRKSGGRCGAKHISKSKVQKTEGFGALLDVQMSFCVSWEGLHFGASDLQVCWDDFAWQVQHFARGRRSTLDRWSGKIAKRIGTRPSALHSTSQNCSVFDVVKFKNWGSLAQLFRFWRCQVQELRKSRVFKLVGRQTDRQTGRQTDR